MSDCDQIQKNSEISQEHKEMGSNDHFRNENEEPSLVQNVTIRFVDSTSVVKTVTLPFLHQADYKITVLSNWKSKCRTRQVKDFCGSYRFIYPPYLTFSDPRVPDRLRAQYEASDPVKDPSANSCYHLASNINEYNAVVNVLEWSGFKRTPSQTKPALFWGKRLHVSCFPHIPKFQKVNHFPASGVLGNKSKLAHNINAMCTKYGDPFKGIIPRTFVLPLQRMEFEKYAKEEVQSKSDPLVWIYKPSNGSCGAGIRLFKSFEDVPDNDANVVVSEYIHNPLLINGFKFDLRIYVFVTSFDPLRVFVFDDGLVRFTTQK